MASAAKIEQTLPDTLPEDFGDWDNESLLATPPVRSGDFDAAPGYAAPKPPAQPIRRGGPQAAPPRKVSVSSNAASPARANIAVADGIRSRASLKAAAMRDADEVLNLSIQSNRARMGNGPRADIKKWMVYSTVPASLMVLMFALVTLFYRGKLPILRHAVEAQPVAADTQPVNTIVEPPMQLASAYQPGAHGTQQTAVIQKATDKKAVNPPQVQSKMMETQLSAPTRIPHDMKLKATDDASSSLNISAANLGQGGNSAIGNIFNGQPQANVTAATPKTLNVSAGIAGGLLIQKTDPVYPEIAKKTRVAGTVVLKATISKTGIIENLHVVSGPGMLTQAAADAVRTWRYKPYKLNNDPVEIETTVNVVFTLGR